jgi:hypothetical protein
MIPNWENAPKWANWLAQDLSGHWWWYENKPKYSEPHATRWVAQYGKCEPVDISHWKDSLQQRPKEV